MLKIAYFIKKINKKNLHFTFFYILKCKIQNVRVQQHNQCGQSLLSELFILLFDFLRESQTSWLYLILLDSTSLLSLAWLSLAFGLCFALVWQFGFPFAFWMGLLLLKSFWNFFQYILMHQIVATTFFWILVSGAMTIPFLQHDQFRSRYVCVCFASDYILRVCLGRKISSDLGSVWT